VVVELQAYDVDSERGFLPPWDPLARLPEQFAGWEELGRELPKLLMTSLLRERIAELPVYDAANLADPRAARRAMAILSFLGHAYVWGGVEAARVIPACLAKPWHQVASMLGRPPVLSYASYALDNWRPVDPRRPLELGNIVLLQNFLGGQDEEWFVLVHVAIEARAAPALAAITAAQKAVAQDDPQAVAGELATVARTLATLHDILQRMTERCDPYVYYRRVRPYLHGWADHPSLPDGVAYEGVDAYGGAPQKFRGETGAQSSIIPSFDAALKISHADDPLRRYLKEMLDYMPPQHRAFIRAIENGPSVRDYTLRVGSTHRELTDAYNASIDGVERFRSTHLEFARRYIINQTRSGHKNPTDVGTGGTPFGRYLKKHRDETARHRLE
jgi:indoleamine 2,3-dioxygenase